MPLAFVYGSSSRRNTLRRRNSTGSMPISPRRDVEEHLAGQRLELPRAAVRRAPDGVRVDRLRREAGARHAVRPGEQHPDRGRGTDRPRRGIRAAVGHEVDVRGLDRAVGVEGHPDVGVLVARLARREQVLAPVLHPLHRRADLRRREHQAHLVALDHDLLPEATAGVAHHHPDAVLRHPEEAAQNSAHLVRRLGRRVDRQLVGAA